MSPPDLALVIVTHQCQKDLPRLAESLQGALAYLQSRFPQTYPSVPMVIVDSGSQDQTPALARALFPEALLIAGENRGFGAAANRGIGATSSRWVLVCNADLAFESESLAALIETLEDPKDWVNACGVIAPQLLWADGRPQASCGPFPTLATVLLDQRRPAAQRKYYPVAPSGPGPVDWATGACLLINRAAWEQVGGFDEAYFLYVEEVDLQYRLNRAGFGTFFQPSARVMHLEPNAHRARRPQVQRWAARGLLRFFASHRSWLALRLLGLMGLLSRRLTWSEALASRDAIRRRSTGG